MPALIDPPEGSDYGFPMSAPLNAQSGPFLSRLPEWLTENGYPRDLIERYEVAKCTRVLGRSADEPE